VYFFEMMYMFSEKAPFYQRGLHSIENQMVFASNPQFIFHDSMGFEAGGTGELDDVKSFIDSRAKATNMRDQLHAVWYIRCLALLVHTNVFASRYCLPTDSNRPLLAADQVFFDECGTGKG
jgi:hypothetical protein